MRDPIIYADKKLRKQILLILLLLFPVGLFLTQSLSSHVEEITALAEHDIGQALAKLRNLVTIFTVANGIFSLAFALYFAFLAMRVLKSEQFPPPGMRVVRDTHLRTGKKAKSMGMLMIFMALVMLSSNLITWYLRVFVKQLIS